ncbi:hypothetical protein MKY41_16185 [Sporosarcina sp. FSL W7-1349]|uniref:hypothetical protein n=1 Tax=Sporosarcina sp. FSL W7-1349 TaxID=2921561 RepID=UPI0030F99222
MPTDEELDELNRAFLRSLEEDDSFGLNGKISTIEFKCRGCREIDDVPDLVVAGFQGDLKQNEEVEIEYPFCGGTIHRSKKDSK